MCEVASWIPSAVADTLRAQSSSQPVIAWLQVLRDSIEEYDPLIAVRPPSPEYEDSDCSSTTPDSAFDEILSQLGKEIYKLDEYQRNLVPGEKEVSLSILNIFDECIQGMHENDKNNELKAVEEVDENCVNSVEECSDGESTLSDVSFVTSTPARSANVASDANSDVNNIFDRGDGKPVPPPRVKLKTPSSTSSAYDNIDLKTQNTIMEVAKRLESDSDSESTCWSYKECSSDTENEGRDAYAKVWSHSSGFHNSDEILRRVLSQNHATVSRLSFDSANDFEPQQYSVYALEEVGGRCVENEMPVVAMTPERPTDDGYEPVRDAITDENIYEEIEYGLSYTDEGCSCGGSVEVESCSISASSEGVGRESPLYENLKDHDAYAIPPDVIFWKERILGDPFYNDDEEDEWITPEECAEYSRDARPPLVIPRISQYRQPRIQRTQHPYVEDTIQESTPVRPLGRPYERLQDWSPTSERGRAELERSFSKASSDSPPIARINKRLGNSTENLLYPNVRRPNNLHLPASSSGDSLDVEIREREPGHVRSRKSRSMVQPKHRMRSPVPAPRMLIPQQSEMPVVYEGAVKRTKFSENGKKSKKNWSDCYVVLTQTGLIFYKDQKTYYASAPKPAGSPPSPTAPRAELVLPLRHASVDFCMQMHTRRYTRSLLISVGRDQYLLQDDTDKGAEKWLFNIKTIIHKLGPPLPDDLSVNQLRNSNTDLESLGRTPPPLRHNNRGKKQVGGSSNEDLSDTTEVSIQKSHVKSRLKKFFAKRPAMEVLVKKGIYKDEPVFGRKLDEVCPTEKGVPRVPNFVVACIKEIESSEENMCTDGLYRASGNLSQVQRIRLQVDQNDLGAIENSSDIHVLTGSLKLFFRELKEPLIPCALFDRVLAACSIKPREAKIKEFRDIIQALPQCNRETLKYLLEHLLRVTQYSEHNRMHTANLAIVFGPTLLWAPAEQAHNIAIDCIQQNNVVEVLLNDFKEIFAEDTKTKKKA
ncbi:rho GTPase-activating protein 9-like isoform X2 [Plodia interpunctella]|uniref:rho GTPase-activating protein 9-like isoform X2 n=1 Tax=Plodia interpunctella TaxID=58824 RepID=UPI00236871C6|nr:rho GTPase-activating protein 9-like isoform X2 [Plodia interpunctella]